MSKKIKSILIRVWLPALLLVMAVACNGVPNSVIQPHDMAGLLADLHLGEVVVETNSSAFSTDSAKYRLKLAIYKRHGVTPEMVDSSLRWYGYHMDKYIEVYDEVTKMLENRLRLAEDRAGEATLQPERPRTMEGDSVDVWPGIRSRRFSDEMPSQILTFDFPSDPNWERGDIYTFRGKMLQNDSRAMLSMAMNYSDGTVEYLTKPLVGDGWHEVRIAADSSKMLREVYGSFVYAPTQGHVTYVDSISLIRSRWKPDMKLVREGMQKLSPKRYAR